MKLYRQHTLKEYLEVLAARTPAPGGGSAAALSAALGVALIEMVANYSVGKNGVKAVEARFGKILRQASQYRRRLLELVDLDAQAYIGVVKARQASAAKKQAALKQARAVPQEICRLCYAAIQLTPFLVHNGNKYLLSDIEVAGELLLAAYNSALINIHVNS